MRFGSFVEVGVGVNARLGWRLTEYVGFELQVEYIPEVDAFSFDSFFFGDLDFERVVGTGNIKIDLSTGLFQPYALLGGGIYYESPSFRDDVSGVFRGGGGFDLYLTDVVALNVEAAYVIAFSRFNEREYIASMVGLSYHF